MPITTPADPRRVHRGLYVGSLAARAATDDYDLVIDCYGAPAPPCACPVVAITPTGRTVHTWAPADLDLLVSEVVPVVDDGGSVLVHCRRGVSRSTAAAAAVLLALGVVDDVDAAMERAKHPRGSPAKSSVGSLRRWWTG